MSGLILKTSWPIWARNLNTCPLIGSTTMEITNLETVVGLRPGSNELTEEMPKPYLTTVSFRGRWVYVKTRRKWKFRHWRFPFGWFITVSYKRVIANPVVTSEEIAQRSSGGTLEQVAWWPEGCEFREVPSVPEGR